MTRPKPSEIKRPPAATETVGSDNNVPSPLWSTERRAEGNRIQIKGQ